MVNLRLKKENQTLARFFISFALLAKNNFMIALLRLLPVFASLLAIPIILKQIGTESYGVYSLYFTFISLSTILDFGYVNNNMYKFQDAYLGSNFNLAKSFYKKFLYDLLKMAGIQSMIFIFVVFPIVAISIYNFRFNIKLDLLLATLIMLCLTPFHILQNFINRTLICINKPREALFFNSLNLVLISVMLMIISKYTRSIALLVFISTFLPLCSFLFQLLRLHKQLQFQIQDSEELKISIPKSNLSKDFTIIQTLGILFLGMDPFLMAPFVTSHTIATYSIVLKVIMLPVSLMSWIQISQLNYIRQIILNKDYDLLSEHWNRYTKKWSILSIASIPIFSFLLELFIKTWTNSTVDITLLESGIAVFCMHLVFLSNYAYQILYALENHKLSRNAMVFAVTLKMLLTTTIFLVTQEFWVAFLGLSISIIAVYVPITFFALRKNLSKSMY